MSEQASEEQAAQVEPLTPFSRLGRSFTGERKVRLGDVDRTGRLRLDALTRYTQDVSDDDTSDAGLDPEPGWVVRSTVVDEVVPAELAEHLHFVTFCSGLGKRWAERRLSISGSGGARYEVATLWVCIDHDAGRPHKLTEQFLRFYGDAAAGRSVSARLTNPKLADFDRPALIIETWQLRVTDFDVYNHVNNAAYWAAVEQWSDPGRSLRSDDNIPGPHRSRRTRMEYGQGLAPAPSVTVARAVDGSGSYLWWLDGGPDGSARACASTTPLPGDLYRS